MSLSRRTQTNVDALLVGLVTAAITAILGLYFKLDWLPYFVVIGSSTALSLAVAGLMQLALHSTAGETEKTPTSIYSDRAALGLPPRPASVTPPLTQPPREPENPREISGERLAQKIHTMTPSARGDWKRLNALRAFSGVNLKGAPASVAAAGRAEQERENQRKTTRSILLAAASYADQMGRQPPNFKDTTPATDIFAAWLASKRQELERESSELALEFSVECAKYQRSQGPIDTSGLERHGQFMALYWQYAKGRWEHAAECLLKMAKSLE